MDEPDDTDPGLAGLSQEFQDMIGGLQGHTESFAKMLDLRMAAKEAKNKVKDDDDFFESYADLAIHEDMLKDAPRSEAYRDAINFHAASWAKRGDVTVIDVGSGTGLLAVLSAKAGAKKVHAVEASRLAHFTRQIAERNSPAGVVEVHECLAEDLKLGDGEEKVADVVVSEWMGYSLLFENMLPSVLSVRNRFLKPGGTMLPSRCRLLLAPIEDSKWREQKLGFWKDVYGIDMSAVAPLAAATFCEKPQHRLLDPAVLLGPAVEILNLDLLTCTDKGLRRFEADVRFEIPAGRRLDGFATWFECEFGEAGWLLSTSPARPATHWRQTAFMFQKPMEASGMPLVVEGTCAFERHESYSRGYRVTFDLGAPGRKPRLETFELR